MTGYTFNQLFDFTRTTSATFVGSNGLIQTTPASVNLLTYTQEFDNAVWVKSATTAAANTTVAPDGTSTADTLTATATTAAHYTQQNVTVVSGQSYAVSVYAKMGTHRYIQFAAGADNPVVNFDLESGVVGTTTSVTSSSITPVGNGWYRCVMVYTATVTSTSLVISEVPSASSARIPSWTAAGTETVYLWGAQIEAGSTATTYTRNNGGLYPARFDYDPVTLAPKGILIEEQRTNLVTYSDQFDNAAWTKVAASVSVNTAVAPSGATAADTLIENTANSIHAALQGTTRTAGVATYTFSVFFKAFGSNRYIRILISDGPTTNYSGAYVDPVTGTIVGSVINVGFTAGSVTITPLGNGWYRGVVTATTDAVSTGLVGQVYLATTASVSSYTGDGTSGVYLWGAQLEAGAFATSYIPTVASQVTRSTDTCAITAPMFAPWYKQTEGTFVAQFSGTGSYAAVANDGTVNNYNGITYNSTTTVRGVTVAAGVFAGITMTGGAVGSVNKTAYGYKLNDLAGSTNGGAIVANATAAIPTVTQLLVGTYGGFGQLNGHIRSIKYYPFRASNNQLQVLST